MQESEDIVGDKSQFQRLGLENVTEIIGNAENLRINMVSDHQPKDVVLTLF